MERVVTSNFAAYPCALAPIQLAATVLPFAHLVQSSSFLPICFWQLSKVVVLRWAMAEISPVPGPLQLQTLTAGQVFCFQPSSHLSTPVVAARPPSFLCS